ncbi:MAG: hypothetical protein GY765_32415 [bacterium]|nr:hypothetical protein [bacterium]
MKDYHGTEAINADEQHESGASWMTLYISLMLVLVTLFIFLTTFAETDKAKIETFKRSFRKSLLLAPQERKGMKTITDMGTPVDPLRSLLNRMKSEGINKKLMDDFLTLNHIKDLEVRDGKRGISVILPEVIGFVEGGEELTKTSRKFLGGVSFLAAELPYLVEVKGYCYNTPEGYTDALEFSARRASIVYGYLLEKDVSPIKLKVAGCGDAFAQSDVPQDKVEITFKEADL